MARRSPTRPLSAEEHDLWRRAARAFKPLDETRLKRLEDPSPPSNKSDLMRQSAPVKGGPSMRDPSPATRNPVNRGSEKKIRRGRVEIEARIDLHGMTQKKARAQLLSFLRRAHENGMRQVLVITGKGAGARAIDQRKFEPWTPEERALPGVLRRSFTQWMSDPAFATLVSGYAESHRRHGGSGAFYVMLRA